jgi:hypothetical protein
MAFKKITSTGENFITTVCSGSGNDLLSGSNSYRLIFSNDPPNTTYTASPKDRNGNIITTNAQLGRELIYWFNEYSKLFDLDANIIAAQAFIESKYVLWAFPSPTLKSSAQGITQFISSTLYDVAIANRGAASNSSVLFTDEEIDRLTNGLTDPRLPSSYIYSDNNSNSTAKANRIQLFQNCMDNPDLLIKAQCRLMKGISFRAADNAASTLFGYNQGPAYVRSTWTATLKRAQPEKLPQSRFNDGIEYVNRIFRVLGDKEYKQHKPRGIWFGYEIDFGFDEFTADVATSGSDINNVNKSTRLSKNYVLGDLITTSRGEVNIPTKEDFEKLEIFANTILEPLNDRFNTRFIVNSSYRSEAVNAGVGGVVSSQHRLAEAADIRLDTTDPNALFEAYEIIVAEKVVDFDQIIYETKGQSIPQRWIHISYKSRNPSGNRNQTLLAELRGKSMKYSPYTA